MASAASETVASAASESASIRVDVFADVICPWCFIGSKRLADGIAMFIADPGPAGAVPVEVHWHPFEPNPDMPAAGKDRREFRSVRFGSWEQSQRMDTQAATAGAEDGLTFRYDLVERTPNTRAAHRLVWLAQQWGLGGEMLTALMAAYFTQGRDIGDHAVLVDLASEVGLATDFATQAVAGHGDHGAAAASAVIADLDRARDLGITGVPHYRFADTHTLPPGAQPAEAIARVLRVVRQNQHEKQVAQPTSSTPPQR